MLKRIRLKIESERLDTGKELLFGAAPIADLPEPSEVEERERTELLTEARYRDDGTRVTISYVESESCGMAGCTTTLSFAKSEPGVLSITRTGAVRTTLLFEQGRRHTCVYNTPVMPFEVCVATRRVRNLLEEEGQLQLEYLVELRGAEAEHTRLQITLLPYFKTPIPAER